MDGEKIRLILTDNLSEVFSATLLSQKARDKNFKVTSIEIAREDALDGRDIETIIDLKDCWFSIIIEEK